MKFINTRIYECYECGNDALALSETSRCVHCTERRLNVNVRQNEELRREIENLESQLKDTTNKIKENRLAIRELRGLIE